MHKHKIRLRGVTVF